MLEDLVVIQLLTKSVREEFKGDEFVISSLFKPQSLDAYEINIIDLSDSEIWRNEDGGNKSIDDINNFRSIADMILNSKKTKILILLPQNIQFQCFWTKYNKYEIALKDMIQNLSYILSILSKYFDSINLMYENTQTKLINNVYNAAFSFNHPDEGRILLYSEKSNKPTAVMLYNNIIATTLEINEYAGLMELLTALKLIHTKQDVPPWFENVRMFDDDEQFKVIEDNNKAIEIANGWISDARKKIDVNNEYKSILYTNGEELVRVVFKILEKMLGCDLSQFEDKKAEDFLFEIDNLVFIGEIKGVNHNVKNENVSQLDVHYQGYLDESDEKSEKQVRAMLIMNHQKNKALDDREPVHEKQIQLAHRNGSLIVETITLLKLFERYLAGSVSREECVKLLGTQTGILNI